MRDLHDSLARACERALVAGARSGRAESRQQVRAAARRFVRRHRRDRALLRFALRSAGASSALAVALLGLAAEPVHAQATLFVPLASDPLAGLDVGLFSAPAHGDLDGDGDLDLVVGTRLGGFAYFENTGSATGAAYAARIGAANPLDGEDVGYFSAPALADVDGDGDLDLVAGEQQGGLFFFENSGDASAPAFVAATGGANPFDGLGTPYGSAPALGDLDADGDLDLVAGDYDGTFYTFENTGSAAAPAFTPRTGAANPLAGLDVGYYGSPALGDLDDDGDLELVAGRADGALVYFANTGDAADPAFTELPDAANPLDSEEVGAFSTPALGDLDADGDLDLVTGDPSGLLFGFENRAGLFIPRTGADDVFPIYGGYTTFSALGDLDLDGDLDLVSGTFGEFSYLENTGTATHPAFVLRTGAANPMDGEDVGSHSAPALGDLDADGDLDLVSGTLAGSFAWYENTGSATTPAFVARTGAANPMDGQDVGSDSVPTLGDLDDDGDLDLLAGEFDGVFSFFENTGSATAPAFVARTGAANPLDGHDLGLWSGPGLGDVDGDGDLDVVSGGRDLFQGLLRYFENTGSASSPAFVARTGAQDPLVEQVSASRLSAALADLDGDGDVDVTAVDFVENAMVEPSPVAFVPEPGHGALLGAGAALLAWLGRRRARRSRNSACATTSRRRASARSSRVR
jgi:hypothetical protein